jgi:hypothetical protein
MEKGARKEKPCKKLVRWRSISNDKMLCFSQKKHQAKRELQRRRMKGGAWTEEVGQKSKKDVPAKKHLQSNCLGRVRTAMEWSHRRGMERRGGGGGAEKQIRCIP